MNVAALLLSHLPPSLLVPKSEPQPAIEWHRMTHLPGFEGRIPQHGWNLSQKSCLLYLYGSKSYPGSLIDEVQAVMAASQHLYAPRSFARARICVVHSTLNSHRMACPILVAMFDGCSHALLRTTHSAVKMENLAFWQVPNHYIPRPDWWTMKHSVHAWRCYGALSECSVSRAGDDNSHSFNHSFNGWLILQL